MTVGVDDAMVLISERQTEVYNRLRLALQEAVGRAWDAVGNVTDDALLAFLDAVEGPVLAAQTQIAALTRTSMAQHLAVAGESAAAEALTVADVTGLRGGTTLAEVYSRPVITMRQALSEVGEEAVEWLVAKARARVRAVSAASMDAAMAQRHAMGHAIEEARAAGVTIPGFRRVLTGASCRFCATASTQRYHVADLMPIHQHCDCGVAPIIGEHDPGRIINRDVLGRLKSQGPRYWKEHGYVDPDGNPVDPATYVKANHAQVQLHGEHGAVFDKGKLGADPPPIVKSDLELAAERFGVSTDAVRAAKAEVRDLRKRVARDAAEAQREAWGILDRAEARKLRRPTRGVTAKGGEYDWMEQLTPQERTRLQRSWFSTNASEAHVYGVDQVAERFREHLPGIQDWSDDEIIARIWLPNTRRAEAAGAIRRGKLPSERGYGGRIDANDFAPSVRADGYDVDLLLSDDLTAAAHIAAVTADRYADDAYAMLGAATNATHGPAPYKMGFQSWEAEVRDLEHGLANWPDDMPADAEARLAELVPSYIDEPGLSYEDLYARIISTAHTAKLDVPDYARIPW